MASKAAKRFGSKGINDAADAIFSGIENSFINLGTTLVTDLQANLRKKGVTFGGNDSQLSNLIRFDISQTKDGIKFQLLMPEYGFAVDGGRKPSEEGSKPGKLKDNITEWVKRKGIVGKFMSKKPVAPNNSTPPETKHIFVNPDKDKYLNPVEYCNNNLDWETVLDGDKNLSVHEDTITFHLQGGEVETLSLDSPYLVIPDRALAKLPQRHPLSKFTCLSILKFKGNYNACMNYITLKYQSNDVPYIRVGTDYFKIIYKKDRYGLPRRTIKAWKKETITLDHTSSILTTQS